MWWLQWRSSLGVWRVRARGRENLRRKRGSARVALWILRLRSLEDGGSARADVGSPRLEMCVLHVRRGVARWTSRVKRC